MTAARTRVKVCGIRSPEEGRAVARLGADAVGLVFHPGSSRFVSPEQAYEISSRIPPFVARVGIFVDEDPETVAVLVHQVGLDAVQLHGSEPPAVCEVLSRETRVIKAFRIREKSDLAGIETYRVSAYLLDSRVEGLPGGTGRTFPWGVAVEAAGRFRPLILSGGLNPENVGEAVRQVRPYAVDVSTGVESGGRKDLAKVEAFIKAVRG
ncbi:MAG: phosphoribosylanthranilate isomerase [Firmicutes bacterium]|nr:phosphoribosylanthranilate isomerase [Bacillota bacterium]